jgi:hypothetical protein
MVDRLSGKLRERSDTHPSKHQAPIMHNREHSSRFTALRLRQFSKNQIGNPSTHVGSVTISTHTFFSEDEGSLPRGSPDKSTARMVASFLSASLGHPIRVLFCLASPGRGKPGSPMICPASVATTTGTPLPCKRFPNNFLASSESP